VHDLPEIFHYWSNKYLLPIQKQFGFVSPEDFFISYCIKYCLENTNIEKIKILSIGSGNGELEILIATKLLNKGISNFFIICMDININMLDRTSQLAKQEGVEKYIKTITDDFNTWKPDFQFNIVLANQSLHHVIELEHLFNSIYEGLVQNGLFLTSDMIGRNGHMRWPEALEALKPFCDELSHEKKYNQQLKRLEDVYINHDCSTEGFEGIRAQDILLLLNQRFNFELFLPFANIVTVFIDRSFGHNFNISDPKDLEFIDRVHQKDEELMIKGILKPTQMLAAMAKCEVENIKLVNPNLTPEFCIRKVS